MLRLRTLLAETRGDEATYRRLRERYRAMGRSFGFEGHIQMAEAIPRLRSNREANPASKQVLETTVQRLQQLFLSTTRVRGTGDTQGTWSPVSPGAPGSHEVIQLDVGSVVPFHGYTFANGL